MRTPDIPLICRIALEDTRAGETSLAAAERVCRENYGDQADAVFAQVVDAVQQRMAAGAASPHTAIMALADSDTPPPPPRRPWWRFWG
jgi:hypothetical protein